MNHVNYVLYRCIKKLTDWLNEKESNFREECYHTYPNGGSATEDYEYYARCNICGNSIMKDSYYEKNE